MSSISYPPIARTTQPAMCTLSKKATLYAIWTKTVSRHIIFPMLCAIFGLNIVSCCVNAAVGHRTWVTTKAVVVPSCTAHCCLVARTRTKLEKFEEEVSRIGRLDAAM